MSAPRPRLLALSERLGIVASYVDVAGSARTPSDATREALVAALGHPAPDEAAAERALADLDAAERACLAEPVQVWREWAGGAPRLELRLPEGTPPFDFALELRLESGELLHSEGRGEPSGARASLALPQRPPPGRHRLRAELALPGGSRRVEQMLVLAPRTAFRIDERLGERPGWGIWSNLYSVRGAAGFGHGTLTDLAELARFAGAAGACFVGLPPLHAVTNRGSDITPYSPASRLYRNLLYLDPEAVPELGASREARALLAAADFGARRRALQAAESLDHEAVLELILPVLRALHASFRRARAAGTTRRGAEFDAFTAAGGERLAGFATFAALAERLRCPDWRAWPEPYRRKDGEAVASFRREHEDDVHFQSWLQFELDRQLAAAAQAARSAGLELGLYNDLAVGSAAGSADSWLEPDLFAAGVSIGAPPDDYAPDGQNWALPPLHPRHLRADGYAGFAALLRSALAHAGALRIDHAMGLARLFWIPDGRSGAEGAYVRYPLEDLLGVLALESRRAGAVIVAEDLGTVPVGFAACLEDWGILSSSVLYFERDAGGFRPAHAIGRRALVSLGSHDLPPLAGFLAGRDLVLRRAAGELAAPGAEAAARAEREQARAALLGRLHEEGLLSGREAAPEAGAVLAAVHGLLARTPAPLVAVSLDDLAGESDPINLPGVPVERHRSWSRRMHRSLEALAHAPEVRAALAPLAGRSRAAAADR